MKMVISSFTLHHDLIRCPVGRGKKSLIKFRRAIFFFGCSEFKWASYSLPNQPIRAHEKHYSRVWYIVPAFIPHSLKKLTVLPKKVIYIL